MFGKHVQTVQCMVQFVRSVAEGFLASWEQIACTNRHKGFEQRHRDWQLIRRGRYVEFNLL